MNRILIKRGEEIMKETLIPLTTQEGDELHFACRGRVDEIVEVPVRVLSGFRGSRFEAEDDYKGMGTIVDNIVVNGVRSFPSGVLTAAFSKAATNNLLMMPTCPAGGIIQVFVCFSKDGQWRGTLRRQSKDDRKYVDATRLLKGLG
jgi:hypothetical protein